MSFIHLHVYSAYSLLTSTAGISGLVKNASDKGFSALALTDRNVMYGAVNFYKECLKQKIKPIIGLTVDVESVAKEDSGYPLVLLAKNNTGYQNLLKITSVVQTKSPSGIPVKWLKHYSDGLIAITPGAEGEIESLVLAGDDARAEELAKIFSDLFGPDHFFLAIQNHLLEQERALNSKLKELSLNLGIGLCASNVVHYLEKEDAFAHECLLAIKNGEKLADEQREKLESDHYYLKTAREMVEYISEYPESLQNSIVIAEKCDVKLDLNQHHLPKYPLDKGVSSERYLEDLCWKGLKLRVAEPKEVYSERLMFELSVIKRMEFSDYFLIVWDFMKYARDHQILTGPGRGSAAGSLVAYCLQITDVDPIEHGLLFERFLNPERISMPDIDIDFPDHRRDEVINYVAKKYGELHVAQIITFGTMAAKAVLRDVGRAYGLNAKELDRLSKLVPPSSGISLSSSLQQSEAMKKFISESPFNKKLFETALKLEGLPRHTSTHAAGVIISEVPLVQMVPVQKGHNDVFLTQYSMEYLDEVGLLKMDFLGLRNLSLIEMILTSIIRNEGKKVDIRSIPLEDEKTFKLLASGETTGIFQLESEGMRKVLTALQPNCFEDIVAVNALYRPGPMENIPQFIDRKHGREAVDYPHPDLEPILRNTYGVIVYQEQIMQIASSIAGFSLGEADLLRRAVSKKQKDVLDRERAHFVKGALAKGHGVDLANELYDLIVKFANYGFNRSHAVAYSLIAYQLAYLKSQFPLHFMAGLLTSAIGNDAKIAQYVRESKQMDVAILSPSINRSAYLFQAEREGIRYSLSAIKGVGAVALKEIIQARKQKPFEDLFDFCLRVSMKTINRKVLEMLVHSGSFDEFDEDRAALLASLDVAIEHAQLVKPEGMERFDLFTGDEFMLKPKYVSVDPIRLEDKLHFEKEALGFYLSDHPISIYEKELKIRGAVALIDAVGNQKRVTAGVYVTEAKKIRTKKGDSMAFFTISDSSGEMEAVAFPETYRKYAVLLNQGKMAAIEGKTEERDSKTQFIIERAEEVPKWLEEHAPTGATLFLKINNELDSPASMQELNQLLKKNKGNTGVILHYAGSNKTIRLPKQQSVSPNSALIQNLKQFLGQNNVILKY